MVMRVGGGCLVVMGIGGVAFIFYLDVRYYCYCVDEYFEDSFLLNKCLYLTWI